MDDEMQEFKRALWLGSDSYRAIKEKFHNTEQNKFSSKEIARLEFIKWMYITGRLQS